MGDGSERGPLAIFCQPLPETNVGFYFQTSVGHLHIHLVNVPGWYFRVRRKGNALAALQNHDGSEGNEDTQQH